MEVLQQAKITCIYSCSCRSVTVYPITFTTHASASVNSPRLVSTPHAGQTAVEHKVRAGVAGNHNTMNLTQQTWRPVSQAVATPSQWSKTASVTREIWLDPLVYAWIRPTGVVEADVYYLSDDLLLSGEQNFIWRHADQVWERKSGWRMASLATPATRNAGTGVVSCLCSRQLLITTQPDQRRNKTRHRWQYSISSTAPHPAHGECSALHRKRASTKSVSCKHRRGPNGSAQATKTNRTTTDRVKKISGKRRE